MRMGRTFDALYDPILGTENAESLLKACWGWVGSQRNVNNESLKQILADTDFKKILEVQCTNSWKGVGLLTWLQITYCC